MMRALVSSVLAAMLAACGASSGGTAATLVDPAGGTGGVAASGGSMGVAGAAGVGAGAAGGAGKAAGGFGGDASGGTGGAAGAAGGGQSGAGGAPYPRTMGQRSLYATSTGNLILDAFTTADTSIGHFHTYSPTTDTTLPFARRITSSSPAGVSAAIAILDAKAAPAPTAGLAALGAVAIVPGSAQPLSASIWVSASDPTGAAVAFATAEKTFQARVNHADGSAAATLQPSPMTLTIDGREWVKLATLGSVSLAQGGYFMLLVEDASHSFFVQAPDLVIAPPGMSLAKPPSSSTPLAPHVHEGADKQQLQRRHPGARTRP